MFKTFLKILMYILVLTLLAAVVIGGVMLAGMDIMIGVYIYAGLIGIWLTYKLIRKLYVRYKARKQVQNIIHEVEVTGSKDDLGDEKTLARDLKKSWKKAISILKKSQLKYKGDPLYVLPWYMIIGKPRSGKSTSLRSAKLLTPELELSEHGEGSTLNLEWWLCDNSIIIDTAGRYAVPENPERDRHEWGKLLKLVAGSREREPLNGLIVAVSAERLLNDDEDIVLEEGRQVRASINALMDKLEIKLPVYLMITKADTIPGFTDWCNYLPEPSMLQAMGYVTPEDDSNVSTLIDDAIDSISSRIKELRLLLLERRQEHDNSIFILPREISKLKEGLDVFAKSALEANMYQEAPELRGMFITSSVRGNGEKGSYFLHDFYTKVITKDRSLLTTLPSSIRMRRAFRNVALGSSGIVFAVAFLLLSGIYSANIQSLTSIVEESDPVEFSAEDDINDTFRSLYRMLVLIEDMEAAHDEWLLPWTGSVGEPIQIQELKQKFTRLFFRKVIGQLDDKLLSQNKGMGGVEIIRLSNGIARRMSLLEQYSMGTVLMDEDTIIETDYLQLLDPEIDADSAEYFTDLYKRYIAWNKTEIPLNEEKVKIKRVLLTMLDRSRGNYEWLIDWANDNVDNEISIYDYWVGTRTLEEPALIQSAFSTAGHEVIKDFFDELEAAQQGEGLEQLKSIRDDFNNYYFNRFAKEWGDFASKFDEGIKTLRSKKEWTQALESMSRGENPYFKFLSDMNREIAIITDEEAFPAKYYVNYFEEMKTYTKTDDGGGDNKMMKKVAKKGLKLLGKAGKVGKLAAKAGKKGMKVAKKAGKGGPNKAVAENAIETAAQHYDDYRKALEDVVFYSNSRAQAIASVTAEFIDPLNMANGDTAGARAWAAVYNLQKILGKPTASSRIFWDLYYGPLSFAYEYMLYEAECELQNLWETDVIAEADGVNPNDKAGVLIGESGVLWSYINDYAKPFMRSKPKKGYAAKTINDKTVDFTSEYFDFVNKSLSGKFVVGTDFAVNLTALPTGVNHEATISPYATFLNLHCADGVQTLSNYNYLTSQVFNWSLEKCGDVFLRIEIGHITLRKHYDGVKGFSEFLRDFRDGRRVFTPADFPAQRSQLENENVVAIDVNYEIRDQEPVLTVLHNIIEPPVKVAQCWDNK